MANATPMTVAIGGQQGVVIERFMYGSDLNRAITSDTDVDAIAVPMNGVGTLLLHIKCTHGSNGVTYTCYGTGVQTDGAPVDFAGGIWEAISGATGAVAAGANVTKSITGRYSWVLIRAKRTTAGQNTEITTYARGTKN